MKENITDKDIRKVFIYYNVVLFNCLFLILLLQDQHDFAPDHTRYNIFR